MGRTEQSLCLDRWQMVWMPCLLDSRCPVLGRAFQQLVAKGEFSLAPPDQACRTCLRGQTFFSLGLRFLYAFIPLVGGSHAPMQ